MACRIFARADFGDKFATYRILPAFKHIARARHLICRRKRKQRVCVALIIGVFFCGSIIFPSTVFQIEPYLKQLVHVIKSNRNNFFGLVAVDFYKVSNRVKRRQIFIHIVQTDFDVIRAVGKIRYSVCAVICIFIFPSIQMLCVKTLVGPEIFKSVKSVVNRFSIYRSGKRSLSIARHGKKTCFNFANLSLSFRITRNDKRKGKISCLYIFRFKTKRICAANNFFRKRGGLSNTFAESSIGGVQIQRKRVLANIYLKGIVCIHRLK